NPDSSIPANGCAPNGISRQPAASLVSVALGRAKWMVTAVMPTRAAKTASAARNHRPECPGSAALPEAVVGIAVAWPQCGHLTRLPASSGLALTFLPQWPQAQETAGAASWELTCFPFHDDPSWLAKSAVVNVSSRSAAHATSSTLTASNGIAYRS